jgi:hypothetical protein
VDIDIPLTAEDRKRLTQALGPSWNADDVAILLARAGASEILALATGRTVPATLADARAFRIFNLLQQGMSLSDAETLVAAIFKVPSATAKRMVNSAVARYAIELQQGLSGTIGEVLEAATVREDAKKRNESAEAQEALRLPIKMTMARSADDLDPRAQPS